MTRTRTPNSTMVAIALDSAGAAFDSLSILVTELTADGGSLAAMHVLVDDRPLTIPITALAYCTGQRARQLVADYEPVGGMFPLVVADKITTEAREILTAAGWSWLDRRGRLHLRGPGVRVDTDVPNQSEVAQFSVTQPISGRGGITVAYWLCAHPDRSLSPNRSAAELGLAPSTISAAVRRLIDAGVVDEDGHGIFPELFWELAGVWSTERRWLASAPDPSLERSADRGAQAWRRSGSAAAIAYGAPIVTTGGEPLELYVPGPVNVSIAVRRHGAAGPGRGPAVITVAPTRAVTAGLDVDDPDPPELDGWLSAPVLAVALDLAQDRARGREILTDWNHPDAVWR
jgi:hypothetical protein